MQLLCGRCGQTVEVDDALGGATYTCPHCGHRINVPDFRAAEGGEAPTAPKLGGTDEGESFLPSSAKPSAPEDDGGDAGFADVAKKSMARRVRVVCGKCGKGISVGVRFAGKRAKCPSCGTMILIPFPDDDKELEATIKAVEHEEFEQLEVVEEDSEEVIEIPPAAPRRIRTRGRRRHMLAVAAGETRSPSALWCCSSPSRASAWRIIGSNWWELSLRRSTSRPPAITPPTLPCRIRRLTFPWPSRTSRPESRSNPSPPTCSPPTAITQRRPTRSMFAFASPSRRLGTCSASPPIRPRWLAAT